MREVVGYAYRKPGSLESDAELARWSQALEGEVTDGGVPGFVAPTSAPELARVLTTVIYTASAQHAAVNFPQFPLMSFAPLFAGAAWAAPPHPGQPVLELVSFLPPRRLAREQADTLYLLSSVRHTRLGRYEDGHFGDPSVEAMAAAFAHRLDELEQVLIREDAGRLEPYPYLRPSLIPQSINI